MKRPSDNASVLDNVTVLKVRKLRLSKETVRHLSTSNTDRTPRTEPSPSIMSCAIC